VEDVLRGLNGKIYNKYKAFVSDTSDLVSMQRLAAMFFRELDWQVFMAYRLPYELTNGIASYFLNAKSKRPGFEEWSEPVVYRPLQKEAGARLEFTENDNRRMQYLLKKQSIVSLSPEEEHELEKLLSLWEHSYLDVNESEIKQSDLSASLAMWP
jgi:hypothetical protein